MHVEQFKKKISSLTESQFDAAALELFQYQAQQNEIYKIFLQHLGANPVHISRPEDIPFLPIEFFKTQKIVSGDWKEQTIFESSGTTGQQRSKHYVKDPSLYLDHAVIHFERTYGSLEDFSILALLPSYLERGNSSLVAMADHFIRLSQAPESGFYLDEFELLAATLQKLSKSNRPTLFLGVTFALIDFAEAFPMALGNTIVMETGGMKGRKKEWTRDEVHFFLKEKFNVPAIHSEYGMTELFSQGYGKEGGIFAPSPWFRAYVRSLDDPLETRKEGKGVLNLIDLANVDSCAFIATMDLGHCLGDSRFTVTGRVDHADVRGCNLLLTS